MKLLIIKKTIEIEEQYKIEELDKIYKDNDGKLLKQYLKDGLLNLTEHSLVKSKFWITDKNGRVRGVLDKECVLGPDENIKVLIDYKE